MRPASQIISQSRLIPLSIPEQAISTAASILARQNITCDQFLALSPSEAYRRTGASFYSAIQHCLRVVALHDKFAALVIQSPNITSSGYTNTRYGYEWIFPYIAYKLLTQIGCNHWNMLGGYKNDAVKQYCNHFGIAKVFDAEASTVTRIADYVCGRMGPSVYTLAPAGQAASSDNSGYWFLFFLSIMIGFFAWGLIAEPPKHRRAAATGSL